MSLAAALRGLLKPNHMKKTPELGEYEKRGIGLVGEYFWTRFYFLRQSVCVLFVVLSTLVLRIL